MELFFLALLVVTLAVALGSGFPVAFAIPGSAILTIALAALCGWLVAGDADAFFVHGGGPGEWLSAGVLNIRGIYRSDASDTLIAIPLFIFMGLMLQRSKVAEDLLLAMAQLFGTVRGGLGVSVVIVGALLAATTSVIGATVVAMGMISLPTMLRNDYSKPLATGVVAATGTLGQIIPPSIVLLILVHQLTTAVNQANAARRALYKATTGEFLMPSQFDVPSVSAGEMFMGALVPGLVLVGLYILYIAVSAFLRPQLAPTVPYEKTGDGSAAVRVLVALVPPLVLILLVLGSIVAGVATVNQAGAIGAAGATMMAGYRLHEGRRGAFTPTVVAILAVVAVALIVNGFHVNLRKIHTDRDVLGVVLAAAASAVLAFALGWSAWRTMRADGTMKYVLEETLKTTSLVFAILLGAVMLTAAFRAFGGEDLVRDFLKSLPGGFWGQFSVAMGLIFVLGFFLDFIEITVVVVPIIAPILLTDPAANITALWLGVMIALNIQTSFLTPPFGFALFYLRGITPPSVRTTDIYKGVVPFIAIQLVALGLIGGFPKLVNYLPNRVLLLSESAPPPTNPRLQACLESEVAHGFAERGSAIRAAIDRARSLDLRGLPAVLRDDLEGGIAKAGEVFQRMTAIERSASAVTEAARDYRPLHARARNLQRDVRRLEQQIATLRETASRPRSVVSAAEAERAHRRIAQLTARRDALLARIPADWKAAHGAFTRLLTAEADARRAYRRTADAAFAPLIATLAAIDGGDRLKALEDDLAALRGMVQDTPPARVLERLGPVRAAVRDVAGADAVAGALSHARNALRGKAPDRDAAGRHLANAAMLLEQEVAWRGHAARDLRPALVAYRAAIADTIGLRSLPRLPDPVAKAVAACMATPRDVFLSF